jgi:hypothetical protein
MNIKRSQNQIDSFLCSQPPDYKRYMLKLLYLHYKDIMYVSSFGGFKVESSISDDNLEFCDV